MSFSIRLRGQVSELAMFISGLGMRNTTGSPLFSDFKSDNSQSRSQSFVPLDQRSENVSSGSNHYERTKEITEFWLSGSLRICIYGACLKWLLPELSFSDRWSRGTKLWERDWIIPGWFVSDRWSMGTKTLGTRVLGPESRNAPRPHAAASNRHTFLSRK